MALQPQKSGHGGDRPQFLLLFLPRYAKGFIRNKPGVATAVVSGLDSGIAYFWKAFPAAAGSEWDIVMVAGERFEVTFSEVGIRIELYKWCNRVDITWLVVNTFI